MKQHKTVTYNLNDKTPVGVGLALGFQHVAAMFTGNLAVALIIAAAVGLFNHGRLPLLSNAPSLPPGNDHRPGPRRRAVGSKLPIVMAGTFTFVGAAAPSAQIRTWVTVLLSALGIIAAFCRRVLGQWIIQKCRHLLTPVVTGAVVLAIGVSLLSYGINYAARKHRQR